MNRPKTLPWIIIQTMYMHTRVLARITILQNTAMPPIILIYTNINLLARFEIRINACAVGDLCYASFLFL